MLLLLLCSWNVYVEGFLRREVGFGVWRYKFLGWRVKPGPNGIFYFYGFALVMMRRLLVVRGKLAGVQVLLAVLMLRSSCSKPASLQGVQPISGIKHSAFCTSCHAHAGCAELCFLETPLQESWRSHPEWKVVWCLVGGVWLEVCDTEYWEGSQRNWGMSGNRCVIVQQEEILVLSLGGGLKPGGWGTWTSCCNSAKKQQRGTGEWIQHFHCEFLCSKEG